MSNDRVAKMQETAAALAGKVRDARLDERAVDLASMAREKVRDAQLDVRAAELAAAARKRAQETGLDDWVGDVVTRVRDSALAQQAVEAAGQVADSARDATDRTLDVLGDWLEDTPVGDRLGIKRRRRRMSPWAIAAASVAAAGVAAGVVASRLRASQPADDDAVWRTASDGIARDEQYRPTATEVAPLDTRVRQAIADDPRTSSLSLNVNVVDGTVFVRGTVDSGADEETLRSVIEPIDGVTDVDVQVTTSA
jgi:hypothetical protein